MATRTDTLFERFLAPIFKTFLIDGEALRRYSESIDWPRAIAQFENPTLTYPEYYQQGNFHGIEGGYLTSGAAITYDPITRYVLPPNEIWVRQGVIDTIQGHPRRILDLGCGTGSTTLLLKQAFPNAEVVGLDLSPHMLVVAADKAQKAGLDIQWIHGDGVHTPFPDGSFDLVTASLLFHETPTAVAQAVLQEGDRLLTVGGEVIILDGNQRTLRWVDWLNEVFEEPHIREYAAGSVDAWMGTAGFASVYTQEHWGIHQVTRGVKPIPVSKENPMTPVMPTAPSPTPSPVIEPPSIPTLLPA